MYDGLGESDLAIACADCGLELLAIGKGECDLLAIWIRQNTIESKAQKEIWLTSSKSQE